MALVTDFAGLWRADIEQDPDHRDQRRDLEFWSRHAAAYDDRGGHPDASTGTIRAIRDLVRPEQSVLDVGTGTGRFALPLAEQGCRVTGLDASAHVLSRAAAKAEERGLSVEWLHQQWPVRLGRQFDVVLAAWSLYRAADLLEALRAILQHARERIILVDGTGAPSSLDRAAAAAGSARPVRQARHLLLAGALAQLGLPADVIIVRETRSCSDEQAASNLSVLDHDQRRAAQEWMEDNLKRDGQRWLLPSCVAVVTCTL